MRLTVLIISLLTIDGSSVAGAQKERTRVLVRHDGVVIETIVDGQGPALVLLPSLARDSEDYDVVAEGLAANGFRVLRPQPRGMGQSTGPLTNITLHDFARDVAEVVDVGYGGGDRKPEALGHGGKPTC